MRILIIKLSALGDFIQSLSSAKAIRQAHPDAEITLLTTKPYVELAKATGYFDDIVIDKRPKLYNVPEVLGLRNALVSRSYDVVFDLQNNGRMKAYRAMLRGHPAWYGHKNRQERKMRARDRHRLFLERAGIADVVRDDLSAIKPNQDVSSLGIMTPYILFVPGCSPQHPEKRWPAKFYAKLAQLAAQKGYQPVILGTSAEEREAKHIEDSCEKALNLVGKTSLLDLPELARGAARSQAAAAGHQSLRRRARSLDHRDPRGVPYRRRAPRNPRRRVGSKTRAITGGRRLAG